jgi:hypothetical protein
MSQFAPSGSVRTHDNAARPPDPAPETIACARTKAIAFSLDAARRTGFHKLTAGT